MKIQKQLSVFLLCLISVFALNGQETKKIVILHTNDTHSQVEPTNHRAKEPNMGGYARRMGVIDSIRAAEQNVLLLDAGDFFQGTPYFNFFNGRVEIDAMNRMKYDAATLGNHEFDNGMDTLAVILQMANFPIVDANYDVSATVLSNLVKPYIVLERFGLRIGIFGLSPEPRGLVFEKNYRGIVFKNPITTAVATSNHLKAKEKCELIICLSHIGTEDIEQYDNDYKIARASKFIDVIIGGHSHTQTENNTTVANKRGRPVVLSQMGKSGLYLGKIELVIND
ncbi:MAG: metallophosphoesterase [Prevotellaceae bacterium]|jgi:5'-nucleotidase|nr:metallophosphoesterase [Prevotellaceae bacterium]